MTREEVEALVAGAVPLFKEQFAERDARIAALEARVVALEAKPSVQDKGVYRPGTVYGPGDIVSHGGSGWIALMVTREAPCGPQTPPGHWRLFVKRGRDGKDLRDAVARPT